MRHTTNIFAIIVALAVGITACAPQADKPAEESMESDLPDTTGASLWTFLQRSNYQETWAKWPDKPAFYTGQEPHGMLLTTYVNELALGAVNTKAGQMPAGSVVVKENYMPDSTLAAITVMHKIEGYNPDHSDWFFAKFLPTGELDAGPNGMALEGRVGGCQSCHAQKKDNDYLFTGVIR